MQREYGIGQKGLSPFKFTTNWNNDRVAVKFEEDKEDHRGMHRLLSQLISGEQAIAFAAASR